MGKNSPMLVELLLIAVAAIAIWAIYHFVPTRERQATAPNENTQAIRGLQSSQLRLIDQVNALQEAVSSGQGEIQRLSGEMTTLNAKLEALQLSVANAQQTQPEPFRRRRSRR
jgi:uncharacterized protein HemX